MKKLINIGFVLIALVVSACGSNNESPRTAAPGAGVPGGVVSVNGVVPTPNGGMTINFSGTNVYKSSLALSVGNMTTSSNCTFSSTCVCGTFSSGYNSCHDFLNSYRGTSTGIAAIGTFAVPGQAIDYWYATSTLEPGAALNITAYQGSDAIHANIVGSLTVPAAFISRRTAAFPQGSATPVIGMIIDLSRSSVNSQASGGLIILTNGNGSSGAFLQML
jgi:hypothetical protein